MKASTLLRVLVWVSFASAFAGIAPAASNNVQVTVESVTDMRSTGNSSPRCNVQLRFSGGDASDAYNIRDIRVTAATDDTGHDLRVPPDPDPERARMRFASTYYGPPGNNFSQQSTHNAELLSPAREAHSIKVLEGEADLLFPTTENGGLVIIKNFMAHPGETFTDPALKKLNLNITYFGNGDEANTTARPVQASTNDRTVQATSPTAGDAVPAVRRLPFRRFPQSRGLTFSIDDPDHRLVDMIFMDAYYRQAWGGMSSMGANTRTYQFQGELPSSLRLYIYLAAPDAIKTVPFKIENIELP